MTELRAPTSFSQQRLWFLDRLEPGSPVYNIARAFRISGRFDHNALRSALNEIVCRHESLRTTFLAADGHPVQVVHPAQIIEMPVASLEHLPEERRRGQALLIAAEEAQLPFDLTLGPLMRARVLRLSRDEHVLIINLHHIVTDGWSMSLFFDEIAEFYEASCRNCAPTVLRIPMQYGDFARRQRASVTEEHFVHGLEFWKRTLDGAPAILELPAERRRPAVQSHRGRQIKVKLPAGMTQRLNDFANSERVTLLGVALLDLRFSGYEGSLAGAKAPTTFLPS